MATIIVTPRSMLLSSNQDLHKGQIPFIMNYKLESGCKKSKNIEKIQFLPLGAIIENFQLTENVSSLKEEDVCQFCLKAKQGE